MKRLVAVLLAGLLMSGVALAGDVAKGQATAAVCSACHGPKGISSNPLWPNLAGQKEQYLIKSIKAFQEGKRQDPSMAPMVANLSDADIENVAAFFSQQDPCN